MIFITNLFFEGATPRSNSGAHLDSIRRPISNSRNEIEFIGESDYQNTSKMVLETDYEASNFFEKSRHALMDYSSSLKQSDRENTFKRSLSSSRDREPDSKWRRYDSSDRRESRARYDDEEHAKRSRHQSPERGDHSRSQGSSQWKKSSQGEKAPHLNTDTGAESSFNLSKYGPATSAPSPRTNDRFAGNSDNTEKRTTSTSKYGPVVAPHPIAASRGSSGFSYGSVKPVSSSLSGSAEAVAVSASAAAPAASRGSSGFSYGSVKPVSSSLSGSAEAVAVSASAAAPAASRGSSGFSYGSVKPVSSSLSGSAEAVAASVSPGN
jgi:hypothetical protein